MKKSFYIMLFVAFQAVSSLGYYATFPNAPSVGQPGSTAIHLSDTNFVAWADGYTNVQYGSYVDSQWKVPANALGQAQGTVVDIVCLGRGGQITLTFSQGITNGIGYDFAIFENGVGDGFLELGWVEVSSDGINYVRFPNYSLTASPVGGFGSMDPRKIFGLASKYRLAYGTPFDLQELQTAYDDALTGNTDFGTTFTDQLTNNFPLLDLGHISYVRIVDIVGDGTTAFDSRGLQIYDPYPTIGSAGFDLDAVGVINQPPPNGLAQMITLSNIPHQKLTFGSVNLNATSDSGLTVSFSVQSGPASIAGNTAIFTGTGVVEVVANQPGNATYAPAPPVLRSFHVAEEIQHIFVEPVPNQIRSSGSVQINAYANSGLPVRMEVTVGPASVLIDEYAHALNLGTEVGSVTLRAFQPGNATHAPAEDVLINFEIVEASASNAPLTLAQWTANHTIPANGLTDSDSDGIIDFQEFVMSGDPNNSNDVPRLTIEPSKDKYDRSAIALDCSFNRSALARMQFTESSDMTNWTYAIPEIIEYDANTNAINIKVLLTIDDPHHYYRLQFNEQ